MENSRQLQIGVMGSAADLNYSTELQTVAEEIGFNIAQNGATLMFGAEKDYDSLSTAACRGAKRGGGRTIGVTYGKTMDDVYERKNVDAIIASGLERGGGRETSLVMSCDGVILVSGGSGTLTEAAIAYQANRPIVAMRGTGGWADKLLQLDDGYIDARRRVKVEGADTAQESVEKIIGMIQSVRSQTNAIFADAVVDLFRTILARKKSPKQSSYTNRLLEKGISKIGGKVIEEAMEVVQAAATGEGKPRVIEESTDLLYHLLVLLAGQDITLDEIAQEIANRKTA